MILYAYFSVAFPSCKMDKLTIPTTPRGITPLQAVIMKV
jgi:hypothetical protein